MRLHPAFVFAVAAAVLPLGACTGNVSAPARQAATPAAASQAAPTDAEWLARGKYLVVIAGCNDCHTAGYGENSGNVPEAQWLRTARIRWMNRFPATCCSRACQNCPRPT